MESKVKNSPPSWSLPALISKWRKGETCPPPSQSEVDDRRESLVVEEVDFSFLDEFLEAESKVVEVDEVVESEGFEDVELVEEGEVAAQEEIAIPITLDDSILSEIDLDAAPPIDLDLIDLTEDDSESLVLDHLEFSSVEADEEVEPVEESQPSEVQAPEPQSPEPQEAVKREEPPMISVNDVMAAISGFADIPTPDVHVGGESSDLIDKFLQLKDYRIVASNEPIEPSYPPTWDGAPDTSPHLFGDDTASEDLAQIYLSQGLYHEAKEIYTRLFLLYSEKSVYFARQIGKIPSTPPENRGYGRKLTAKVKGRLRSELADNEADSGDVGDLHGDE